MTEQIFWGPPILLGVAGGLPTYTLSMPWELGWRDWDPAGDSGEPYAPAPVESSDLVTPTGDAAVRGPTYLLAASELTSTILTITSEGPTPIVSQKAPMSSCVIVDFDVLRKRWDDNETPVPSGYRPHCTLEIRNTHGCWDRYFGGAGDVAHALEQTYQLYHLPSSPYADPASGLAELHTVPTTGTPSWAWGGQQNSSLLPWQSGIPAGASLLWEDQIYSADEPSVVLEDNATVVEIPVGPGQAVAADSTFDCVVLWLTTKAQASGTRLQVMSTPPAAGTDHYIARHAHFTVRAKNLHWLPS